MPLPASVVDYGPLKIWLPGTYLHVTARRREQIHFRRQENSKNNLKILCDRHKRKHLPILYEYI